MERPSPQSRAPFVNGFAAWKRRKSAQVRQRRGGEPTMADAAGLTRRFGTTAILAQASIGLVPSGVN